jgi:hypothetical protein
MLHRERNGKGNGIGVTAGHETPAKAASSTGELTNNQIEVRAYELYKARGCRDGFDQQDWLQAESELKSQRSSN